ncbi:MAG: heavy-metal-associated domain-containing protein [Phycisphaerales bacterium]
MHLHEMLLISAAGAAIAIGMLGCASGDVGPAASNTSATAGRSSAPMSADTTSTSGTNAPETAGQVSAASWTVRSADDSRPISGDTARLTVRGMSCPKCANNIDRQLQRVTGVSGINIDMSTGHVDVSFRPGVKASPKELAQAITNTGFTLVEVAER